MRRWALRRRRSCCRQRRRRRCLRCRSCSTDMRTRTRTCRMTIVGVSTTSGGSTSSSTVSRALAALCPGKRPRTFSAPSVIDVPLTQAPQQTRKRESTRTCEIFGRWRALCFGDYCPFTSRRVPASAHRQYRLSTAAPSPARPRSRPLHSPVTLRCLDRSGKPTNSFTEGPHPHPRGRYLCSR